MKRANITKSRIHQWLKDNPRAWRTATVADVARLTGLSWRSVNLYLDICIAEHEGGGLPSEYEKQRREANPVRRKRIKDRAKVCELHSKGTPIKDIMFHTGLSYDTVRAILWEHANNDDKPMSKEQQKAETLLLLEWVKRNPIDWVLYTTDQIAKKAKVSRRIVSDRLTYVVSKVHNLSTGAAERIRMLQDSIIDKTRAYIVEHLEQEYSIDIIAKHYGLHPWNVRAIEHSLKEEETTNIRRDNGKT